MSDGDEIAALQVLAERLRALSSQISSRSRVDDSRYAELKPAIDKVAAIEKVIASYQMDDVPHKDRKNLPDVLDWWGDRQDHARDWRFYLPLVLGFVGPIVGGIIVVLITHGL